MSFHMKSSQKNRQNNGNYRNRIDQFGIVECVFLESNTYQGSDQR